MKTISQIFLLCLLPLLSVLQAANPDGGLRIEVTTAYNFIVDSNVGTPASYAPSAAYISARIWNDGTTTITDVVAKVGDGATAGVYPSVTNPATGQVGTFSLVHEGGSNGLNDATRQLGSIAPGEYLPVYWLVSYPNLDDDDTSVTRGSKPFDDLVLEYSIWVDGLEGATPRTAQVDRTATMRSCISAMANKILPNGANKVPQEYKDLLEKYSPSWDNFASDGSPGTSVVTEGIWYDLGNVGQGFDNNGDFVPDQNAWLQPVGDPSIFDPSAFRLVNTYALIVVKLKSGGEQVYDVSDQLYFENLPENTGVIGLVRYDFLPLKASSSSQLSPYQMAASGFDNEKFNGDFGASIGGLNSIASQVTLDKSVDLATANLGDTLEYTLDFENTGTEPIGNLLIELPLVVQDSIPANTTYVSGSATAANVLPASVGAYTVYYSDDDGATWSTSEPVPASDVTDLQWWLSDELLSAESGTVTFDVTIDNVSGVLAVPNTGGLSLGNALPFITDTVSTLIPGTLNISGTVFEDDGTGGGLFGDGIQTGTEPGINAVTVTLYYDANNDGIINGGDLELDTDTTDSSGDYDFGLLADGNYIVKVDKTAASIPAGSTLTTAEEITVTLNGSDVTEVDFGFAPTLLVTKTGTLSAKEGEAVAYTVTVENKYSASGVQKVTTYWASSVTTSGQANKLWMNPTFAQNEPDGSGATAAFDNAGEFIIASGFGTPTGTISSVELIAVASGTNVGAANSNAHLELAFTGVTLNAASNADITDTGFNPPASTGSPYTFARTLTKIAGTWTPAEVAALTVEFDTNKPSGQNTATFSMDAIGIRVTTTEISSLATVPFTDTYNTTDLTFIDATVDGSPSSPDSNSSGVLSWNDITGAGSLAPGDSIDVVLNFTANNLISNTTLTTTDTAAVTGATFTNGDPANDASDSADTDIIPQGSIGRIVFFDVNQNGQQDPGEPGIGGVTMDLFDASDLINPIATVVTSTDPSDLGSYQFTGLDAGDYVVVVDAGSAALSGAVLTADPENDGEPCLGTCDGEDETTLAQGAQYAGANFGYFLPGGVISGTLWIDFDGDDSVGATETRLPYVTVDLDDGAGNVLATTETDADGNYSFGGLADGSYRVLVTDTESSKPASITQSFEIDASLNETVPSIIVTGGSVTTANSVASTGDDINFGYRYNGDNSLSGTIGLEDASTTNGVMGSGDSGVDGDEIAFEGVNVYLTLWQDAGTLGTIESGETVLLGSTTTDANGDYSFTNLPESIGANDYYIVSTVPPINNLTLQTVDANTPATLLVNTTNAQSHSTGAYQAIPIQQSIVGVDFAYLSAVEYDFGDLPASYAVLLPSGARHIVKVVPDLYLGSDVSEEANGSISADSSADTFDDGVVITGIWQNGTQGGSVDVSAVGSGYLVGYIDFNNDGDFSDNGEMVVSQTVSDETVSVTFDIPADALSEIDTTAFYSRFRLLPTAPFIPELAYTGEASNGEVEDYQSEFYALSGTVYDDTEAGGSISAGDEVRAGIIIELFKGSTLVATTVTDLNGAYSFYGLPPDDYEIRMTTPTGTTAIFDVDGSGNGNNSIDRSLSSTLTEQDYLLGTGLSAASISGTYWVDGDASGSLPGVSPDTVLSGVIIELYRDINANNVADANEFIGSDVTDANGDYLFTDLPDGDYIVLSTTPSGATALDDADGNLNGFEQIETSLSGSPITDQDFLIDGAVVLANISGVLYRDDDGDNGFSGGDVAVNALTVALYLDGNGNGIAEPNELVSTTLSSGGGAYNFDGLPSGDYLVSYTPSTGTVAVLDTDGSSNGAALIGVALAGTNISNQNFLFDYDGIISGSVTIDQTGDNNGDVPQEAVSITLYDDNDVEITSTTTAPDGSYSFTELPPGDYKVRQTVPNGFVAVNDVDGSDLEIIGDVSLITLPASGTVTGQNFVNSQSGVVSEPDFCLMIMGTTNGSFIRPTDMPANVVYKLEFADELDAPTTWDGTVTLSAANTTVVDNLDGTETVTITDIPTLTGLNAGYGFVRLRIEVDLDNNASADETTLSAVSGWVDSDFGTFCRTYNNPFLSCPSFTADVSSAGGSTLTFTETVPALGAGSYYIEVTAGDNEGQRFDIAATDTNSITIDPDVDICDYVAPFNTQTGQAPDLIAGDTIVVRKHQTLNDWFPVDQMTANDDQALADQISLWNGTSFDCYYLYDGGAPKWVKIADESLNDAGGVIIPPGEGTFVNSQGSKSLRAYGQVRENDFVRPLCQGNNLVAGGYPVDQSPASREMKLPEFTGNPNYKYADKIYIWKGDAIEGELTYDIYYLVDWSSIQYWVKQADYSYTSRDAEVLFKRDHATKNLMEEALLNNIHPQPWTP